MNYWLRKPGSSDFTGPLTLDEIRTAIRTGSVTWDFEALAAAGQSYVALQRSTGWEALATVCPQESTMVSQPSDVISWDSQPKVPTISDLFKRSSLARWAVWSGGLTIGVPLIWAVVVQMLAGAGANNAALGVGWFGVLPMILLVPIGIIVTLVLAIAAVISANKGKSETKPAAPRNSNSEERNV